VCKYLVNAYLKSIFAHQLKKNNNNNDSFDDDADNANDGFKPFLLFKRKLQNGLFKSGI